MASLEAQGFSFNGDELIPPKKVDKATIRRLHQAAVDHRIERAERYTRRMEDDFLSHIANGDEIDPTAIEPQLVQVRRNSDEELLFRYVSLHWSIPVSSGYGRRLRYLVLDRHNGKLIGAFGLGDPVINLGVRDSWIGWNKAQRESQLHNVMEAFLIGAVPPYSHLLCGKLVASLIASNEVRRAFARKYGGQDARSRIRNRHLDGRLVLVTTLSALGRSSIYNRLRHDGQTLYQPLGFTQGYGDFHFSNGLYSAISDHAKKWCSPTARKAEWGEGFRNRREVIKKTLVDLQLPTEWVHHGIRREVFAVPLARRAREYLRGEVRNPHWFDRPAAELFESFRVRWLIPRAGRREDFKTYHREQYRLWPES